MIPIKYIDQTREFFAAQGFPPYEWTVNDIAPFTPIKKKLKDCRVALLSTGGMYIRGQQLPFNPEKNDLTFREIPKDIDIKLLSVSHSNYDHTNAELDINCVFPIERFRELEVEGYIGELAPVSFTIMGRIFRRTVLENEMAPEILRRLKDEGVDIFFLVPAWPVCHQSVGLIARIVEEGGVPTISVSSARDVTESVKPPRSVFVNFPLGNTTGKPFDRDLQMAIIKDAFDALKSIKEPGTIIDLPYEWDEGNDGLEKEPEQ